MIEMLMFEVNFFGIDWSHFKNEKKDGSWTMRTIKRQQLFPCFSCYLMNFACQRYAFIFTHSTESVTNLTFLFIPSLSSSFQDIKLHILCEKNILSSYSLAS